MILKQGHTYRAMPHDGKVIRRIYRGGRCYYIASPYSLEATQALKAAFPQYWTAIRDYGYAHPQLVPFINEDPMLIVSLVEVGKVRTLDGDGKAYINTLLNPTGDLYIACLTKDGFNSESYAVLFGASKGVYTSLNTNAWNYGVNTDRGWGTGATTGKLFEVNKGTLSVDGLVVQVWTQQTFEVSIPLFLYADNNGAARRFSKAKIAYCKINREETSLLHLIPYLHPTEGAGMLDIVSLTFHPNANTEGTFTIAITDKE